MEEVKTEVTVPVEPEPELDARVSVASCQPCRHCLPTCGQEVCHHLDTPGPGQQGQPAGAPVEGEGGSHHLVPLPETGWDCHCFVRIQRGFIQAKPLTSILFQLEFM